MDAKPVAEGETEFEGRDGDVRSFLRMLLRLLSWRFVGLVLLTLVIGLVSGISLVLLMPMLQVVGLEVGGGAGESFVRAVAAVLGVIGLEATLPTVLALNAFAVVATALLQRFQTVHSARMNQSVVRRLRQDLYRAVSEAEWRFIASERSSRFNHVLLGELERVGAAVSAMVSLLVGGGRVLAYATVALVLSPVITLLSLACGALLSLLLLHRTRLGRKAGEAVSDAYEELYAATGEHLDGLKFIKSHALEGSMSETYRRVTDRVADTHVEVVRNQADVGFWLQVGTVAALSLIIYFALVLLALPLATVLLLIYLFSRLLPMVASSQKSYQALLNLLPAYTRFVAVLERSRAEQESARDDLKSISLRRGIELRGVSFRYSDDGEAAVAGLDLEITAGRTTALVGTSGAGKSTIADIVIGLVSPTSGRLLIDGEPLRGDQRRVWRSGIAYVSQDMFLFHDTIRENLLSASPGASERAMWESLELAAADFVADLPRGLDTVVGDRGLRLSGGERQRIVLARALLRKPALLVLDEATSALDAVNEERIKEAIEQLSGHMTILVIAHRLAAIRSAHVIHYLEGGRIIESGSWSSLLARPAGRLRSLAEAQGLTTATVAPPPVAGRVQGPA